MAWPYWFGLRGYGMAEIQFIYLYPNKGIDNSCIYIIDYHTHKINYQFYLDQNETLHIFDASN